MKRAPLASVFSRGSTIGRVAVVSIALLSPLAAPSRSPAQDAGVSGIPPGPANARGLNGSVNDPSGIGNAAKLPALPQPTITPAIPPTVSAPVVTRTFPVQRAVRLNRTRFTISRHHRPEAKATVRKQATAKPQDRLSNGGIPSICRGC
jgi:hypothetical protein